MSVIFIGTNQTNIYIISICIYEYHEKYKGSSIKDVRTKVQRGRGRGKPNLDATALLIFACKRPKYAKTGDGGPKTVKFCGRPLWIAPNVTEDVYKKQKATIARLNELCKEKLTYYSPTNSSSLLLSVL